MSKSDPHHIVSDVPSLSHNLEYSNISVQIHNKDHMNLKNTTGFVLIMSDVIVID